MKNSEKRKTKDLRTKEKALELHHKLCKEDRGKCKGCKKLEKEIKALKKKVGRGTNAGGI